jgi:hypothetical protein
MNKRKYSEEFLLRRFDERKIECVRKKHRVYNDLGYVRNEKMKRINVDEKKEEIVEKLSSDEIYEFYY